MSALSEAAIRVAAAAQYAAYGDFGTAAWTALGDLLSQADEWARPDLYLASSGTENGEFWTYENGFFTSSLATAFVAQRDGELVISFRGSDNFPFDQLDAALSPQTQIIHLAPLLRAVLGYIRDDTSVTSIVVTGHSLGGELAELFVALCSDTLTDPGNQSVLSVADIHLVTFGSPGTPLFLSPVFRSDLSAFDLDADGQPDTEPLPTVLPAGLGTSLAIGNTEDLVFNHLGIVSPLAGSHTHKNLEIYASSLDNTLGLFESASTPGTFEEHSQYLYYQTWTEVFEFKYLSEFSGSFDIAAESRIRALATTARPIGGTANDDQIIADHGYVYLGLDGNDLLRSGLVDDRPFFASGGGGNDALIGGLGGDFLDGGLGNDALTGLSGDDHLNGGAGKDSFNAGLGNDTIEGGSGDDVYSIGVGQGSDRVQDNGDGSDILALSTGSLTYSSSWLSADGGDLLIRAPNGAGGYDIDIRIAGMGTALGRVEAMDILPGDGNTVTQTVNLVEEWARLTGGGDPIDDYGEDITTNGLLQIGGSLQGSIETPLDTDWFAVSLVAGKTYEFDLTGIDGGGGTLADPFMRVRDALGQSLVFNEDAAATTRDSRIVFTAPETATYFVSVGGDLLTGGTYTLSSAELGGPQQTSGEMLVNNPSLEYQFPGSVSVLPDGGYVVAWSSRGEGFFATDVYSQRFDASGAKVGSETRVNTTTDQGQTSPDIATLSNGGYVISWSGADDGIVGIFAQQFDATGNKIGPELRVHTSTTGHHGEPSVAALSDGGFVVSWRGPDSAIQGVFAQRFDAAGNKVGSETAVNTYTAGYQFAPSVAALPGGGFVVSWMSQNQDGSGYGIYLQRFDAAGAKDGAETLVNTTTSGNQQNPSIAALEGGGFVIGWDSHDGNADVIRLQRFDATGAKVGAETLIDTALAFRPQIAAIPGGGFVVSWDADGAYTQQFDADGARVGVQTRVNISTTGVFDPDVAALPEGGYVVTWGSRDSAGNGDISSRIIATPTVSIAASDATKAEGAAGATSFTFSVTRAGNTSQQTTVEYSVVGFGLNAAAANDFVGGSSPTGVVMFEAGETTKVLTIPVAGDGVLEANEGFSVSLSNVSAGGAIAAGVAYGTISNDDAAGGTSLIGTAGPDALNGGTGDDTLSGLEGSDLLRGNAGADSLIGGSGDDLLDGGVGDDVLDGGIGIDRALYSGATSGVEVSLAVSGAQTTGGGGVDTLVSIEGLEGGEFADTLTGNSGDNFLDGRGGGDFLSGDGGNDFLLGGAGDDTLLGGAGVDALRGGAGDDRLDGGEGYDFATYFDATAGMLVRLAELGPQNTGGAGIDTLLGIEAVSGSQFGDTLVGTETGDQFYGEAGNDSLAGLGGNDVFRGDAGNDTVDGGTGIDQISYQYDTAAVNVDLAIAGPQITGGSGTDHLIGIEQVVGSAFNDTLGGDGAANFLNGFNGDDSLSGRGGNDTLFLGEGNDTGVGGDGDDRIEGGSGNDTMNGDIGNDTLIGGVGSDTAAGGAGNDSLSGGAEADSLSGADGNDTLQGGSGDDLLAAGRGADVFIFGAGFGHDTIIDFRRIEDEIRFEGAGFTDFADMMAHALQVGRHVVITNAAGDSLQLNNVLLSSLHSADFLFS